MKQKESFQSVKDRILNKANKLIAEEGYYKISSCDAPNWNTQEHFALLDLYNNPPENMNITFEINYEIYDWVFMGKNNHRCIQPIEFEIDEIIRISACMADTILKPLYDYVNKRGFQGYIGTLDIIAQWTKEFYRQYNSKIGDWDFFEESDDNIYNAACWDDFLIDWTNARFKKFKEEFDQTDAFLPSGRQYYGSSKIPKLIIIIKNRSLSAVYSNIPIQFAHIDFDDKEIANCPLVGVFEPDTIANDLITVFDQNEPQQQAIQEELISQGF